MFTETFPSIESLFFLPLFRLSGVMSQYTVKILNATINITHADDDDDDDNDDVIRARKRLNF
jgi:hypothetical protein